MSVQKVTKTFATLQQIKNIRANLKKERGGGKENISTLDYAGIMAVSKVLHLQGVEI